MPEICFFQDGNGHGKKLIVGLDGPRLTRPGPLVPLSRSTVLNSLKICPRTRRTKCCMARAVPVHHHHNRYLQYPYVQ